MEFHPLLALGINPLAPIILGLHAVLSAIFGMVHNYGWSLILLAFLVKLVFWPLNTMQFKAMLKTQRIQPQIQALRARHKNDSKRLNEETMALYKETGANPLASCLPMLLQLPILISLYQAVNSDKAMFARSTWLWIGSPASLSAPYHFLAANLSRPDYVLLALYIVSMYFSVRFTSPAMDPQQAQQQKIMAFVSPAMIGYMGLRFAWPSALILYWLAFNLFTMAQQLFLINKYHNNPAPFGPHPEAALAAADGAAAAPPKNGPPQAKASAKNVSGAPRAARKRRSSRR